MDLINRFGSAGGFEKLSARFTSLAGLSVPIAFAYIRPFGCCADFLTRHTVETWLAPILVAIPAFLEQLTDEELKKETARSDMISSIIKCLKSLQLVRTNDTEDGMRNLEIFRLKMILRMLKVRN